MKCQYQKNPCILGQPRDLQNVAAKNHCKMPYSCPGRCIFNSRKHRSLQLCSHSCGNTILDMLLLVSVLSHPEFQLLGHTAWDFGEEIWSSVIKYYFALGKINKWASSAAYFVTVLRTGLHFSDK